MLAVKFLLIVIADLMFVASFAIVLNAVWLRLGGKCEAASCASPMRWLAGLLIGGLAWIPLLLAMWVANLG